MESLLRYSLERISSLQNFYKSEKSEIDKKARQGMMRNRFGFDLEAYFNILVNEYEDYKDREDFQKFERRILDQIEVIESGDEKERKYVSYRFKNVDALKEQELELNVKKAVAAFKQFADMPIIHGNNTIIMLITRFEEFLSTFFRILYQMFPQKYLNAQQITFSEIENKGIEAVRHTIISREVENLMRKSYSDWFDLLSSHGIKLTACEHEVETLKEIYARRNILVHNGGVVNLTYLKNVPNSTFCVGDKLKADEEYLDNAFLTIKIIIFTIHIEAARLIKDEAIAYTSDIFNYAFDFLQSGEYVLCRSVFLSLYSSKYVDSLTKQMSQVNYWIASSEVDGAESIRKEVEAFDVLTLQEIFSLAKKLLLQEYEEVNTILEELYHKEEVFPYMIEEWPLFKKYRNTEQYQRFKSKHAEDFDVEIVETGSNDSTGDEICADIAIS